MALYTKWLSELFITVKIMEEIEVSNGGGK